MNLNFETFCRNCFTFVWECILSARTAIFIKFQNSHIFATFVPIFAVMDGRYILHCYHSKIVHFTAFIWRFLANYNLLQR